MVIRQLERLAAARSLDQIVMATSSDSSDDQLAAIVDEAGFEILRGPLDDVLGRFSLVVDRYQPEVVVRLTADCPLISPGVLDEIVDSFHASQVDYLSNTMEPTYPDGLDVEVVLASVLREVAESATDPAEREHVTLGVYRHPESYRIGSYRDPVGRDNSRFIWTVDNEEDFAFVSEVYRRLLRMKPVFEYEDVLDLLESEPSLHRDDSSTARNAALDGVDTGVMMHRGKQS